MSLRTDLVSWWELDDDGVWADSHGSNDLSEFGNPTTITGGAPDGEDSADFESTNTDYLAIDPAPSNLNFGDDNFSFAAWAKLESKTGSDMGIVAIRNGVTDLAYQVTFDDSDDAFRFLVGDNSASFGTATETTVGSPSLGTWYFVYAYHDADNNELGVSVNDNTLDTSAWTTGVKVPTGIKFSVGSANPDGTGDKILWDGELCKIAAYNRVLASSEVTELYNSGSGLIYADTAAATFTPKTIIY